MDFGAVDLDSLVCCSSSVTVASNNAGFSFEIDKQKGFGSGFLKQERGVNERTHCSNLSEGQQQMLSFSSPSSLLPYYHQTSNGFDRGTGFGFTGLNSAGAFTGIRIPFTPSQWVELEHQALIYKYITSNMPIPYCLLKPMESAGFSTFSALRSTPLGWGAFQIGGFSSSDPEPGRCRRTDGKKWRCSRDAVADQKYCERHMNRGRHRSRKPVEATRTTTAMNNTAAPIASAMPVTSGSATNVSDILVLASFDRSLLEKESNSSISKQQNSFHGFGFGCSNSQLNPMNRSSAFGHCRNIEESEYLYDKDNESGGNNPLGQFMDAWYESHSDRTQLSISIPMVSPSSPTSSKLQRSSQELEMCLAVGTTSAQHNQRQDTNWFPISWEPSMAGPLGEVLNNTTCATGDSLNAKPLNLMESLDNNFHLASSPTRVLSRCTFGSLSNSSAGSSPRAESSKARDGSSLCNGIIPGMTMTTSLPNL